VPPKKTIPPAYFLALLLLSIALGVFLPVVRIVHYPYTYVGIAPIAIGVLLNFWADALFQRNKTPVKPHLKPTALITSGIFRVTRNPMYLGMVLILFGVSVCVGPMMAFVSPVVFFLISERRFIPPEEAAMENLFGETYLELQAKRQAVGVDQAAFRSMLTAIKILHTAVWSLMAGSILAFANHGHVARLPVERSPDRPDPAGMCGSGFKWRPVCLLTDLAARYTAERAANSDIYLPLWLARYNKPIFGAFVHCRRSRARRIASADQAASFQIAVQNQDTEAADQSGSCGYTFARTP
jgi:protein-S-isoprenylcysteine O-methyltransferase Ste14